MWHAEDKTEKHCRRQEFVHLPRYVWELKLRISFMCLKNSCNYLKVDGKIR